MSPLMVPVVLRPASTCQTGSPSVYKPMGTASSLLQLGWCWHHREHLPRLHHKSFASCQTWLGLLAASAARGCPGCLDPANAALGVHPGLACQRTDALPQHSPEQVSHGQQVGTHVHERGFASARAAHEGSQAARPEGPADVAQESQLRLGTALHLTTATLRPCMRRPTVEIPSAECSVAGQTPLVVPALTSATPAYERVRVAGSRQQAAEITGRQLCHRLGATGEATGEAMPAAQGPRTWSPFTSEPAGTSTL